MPNGKRRSSDGGGGVTGFGNEMVTWLVVAMFQWCSRNAAKTAGDSVGVHRTAARGYWLGKER